MPLFKLIRKVEQVPQDLTLEVKHEDIARTDTLPVTEVSPGPGKKYMVTVEVGDLPPQDALAYVKRSHHMLKEFFGDNVMVVPARRGEMSIGVYEVEPLHEPEDGNAQR